MNLFKRFTALLLAVLLVTGLFPVHASADEQEPLTFETNYINPLYADIVTEEDIPPVVTQRVQTYETVKYATTVEEAGIVLREQMKARMEAPVVHIFSNISATQEEFNALCRDLYEVVITHTQEPDEGDYIRWHLSGYTASGTLAPVDGGYNIDIAYSVEYHSNTEQEAAVDAAVEALLSQLNLSGKSDYEKVKAVYDYICENVRYDKTSSGTLKHTAYAALINKTSVCQGYASLLYRLLLELDVDTRVISGIGNGGAHGWNIVELDNRYYNADSTWDEGQTSYSWFLRSPANFPDHVRDTEYDTAAFNSAYPMASADYAPHTHSYTAAVTKPTCTENGYTTYTCSCGYTYQDDIVAATGHSFGDWYQVKAPTEAEEGQEQRNCENCDYFETRVLEKLEPSDPYSGTCGDNLTWKLDEEGTIIISGTGAMYDYNTSRAPWKESGITIRRIIIEEGVTRVGREAFIADYGTVWLTVIPSTLTSIGSQGLMCGSRCVVINSETIAQDATVYDAIGYLLFHSNTVLIKNGMSYGSYVKNGRSYSSNVEFQGEEYTMFSECSSHLYKQYDALGMELLMCDNCSAVRDFSDVEFDASATDADNVTAKIYKSGNKVVLAFSGYGEISTSHSPWLEYCLLITHVEIDDQITSIPYRAFYYFLNLTNITIPANIASIGSLAFSDCTSLTDIVFQGNAPVIDDYAFRGVTATAYYPANNPTWTTDVMQNYGGNITWVAYDLCGSGHSFGADHRCAVCGIIGGICGDDLTWILEEATGALTISGTGDMYDHVKSTDMPWYDFRDQITSVEVQSGATSLGMYAFEECINLKEISLPDSLTGIGASAFLKCTSLERIVIPGSVTEIPYGLFTECSKLEEVTLPNGITSIGEIAFANCSSLSRIDLPDSVTNIGVSAFVWCDSLKEIRFLGDAPVIEADSFAGVTATAYYSAGNSTWTTSVMQNYGGTITWVPYGDVHEHTEVIDAAVEPTCTETGLTEGKHCSECGEILVAQEEIPALGHSYENGSCTVCGEADPDYSTAVKIASGWSGDLTWVLTDDGVLTFSGSGAMKNYGYKSEMPWYKYIDQITSVVINEGATRIGDYAFYGMTKLETIDIAETVTYIGDFSFKGSTALDGVVLPPNLSNLGTSAFYGCTGLTSIEIPASLYTVKPYAFKNCSSLAKVTFHEGNLMKLSDGSFYGTALTEVEFPKCLDIIDVYCFKNCFQLASITIPEGDLTQIREAVFYATAIPSITIPEGVTKVGPYAFKNCVNLKTVSLPTTLTSVGEASFYACTGLQGITIPDAVTSIGDYAFRKCAAITEVNLGSELTDIGLCAFYGCSGLTNLEIPDKVTTIQGYAFKGCTGLTSVKLGSSVETLGESAFHTCTALKTLELPASLKTIGDYCFSGSYNLWQLTFNGNAPSIGSGAFKSMAATACYPANDSTWTSDVMQNYGGSITWKADD